MYAKSLICLPLHENTDPHSADRGRESDLKEIGQFTREQWGRRQAARYLSVLRRRIDILLQFPASAPSFSERPGVRRLVCGSHLVFYRIEEDTILVSRILSHRMDPSLHLPEEPH